jgi:general secretion pathway protein A
MYTAFFGLREKPFGLSPDPRFLFLSAAHREALAHLLYGIEQGEGFIAVTGEVGTGKTTLCRTLLRRLGPEVEVAFLFNPKLSARELLESIVIELGLEKRGASARELIDELNHFLLERRRQGRRVLLIVDEAQGLASDTLEQIRLLSNLETETEKLIQILLLGQPELDTMLESDELRQLRQRIAVRWRLAPLSRDETAEYVRHRLRVSAGADRDHLFSDAALREVYRRSYGVPRIVNLLCDRALLAGFGDGAPAIDATHVSRAARETAVGANEERRGASRRRAAAIAAAAGIGVLIAATAWLGTDVLRSAAPTLLARAPESGRTTERVADPAPPTPLGVATAGAPVPIPDVVHALLEPELPAVAAPPPTSEPEPAMPISAPASASVRTVDDLAVALALRAPGATASEALAGALDAWSMPAASDPGPPIFSLRSLVTTLEASGLGVLPLPDADLSLLRVIAHPALIAAFAADGVPRIVLVRRIEGDALELIGVREGESVRVEAATLEQAWAGEAYVVWREFEALPGMLRIRDQGDGVIWLQAALAELGFTTEEPSGVFDEETEFAVRAFQMDRQLPVDGAVGPLTKMSLYRALGRYEAPDLVARIASGGAG